MYRLAGLVGGFGTVVAAAMVACGGDDLVLPGETSPAEIAVITGNNQRGPAGLPLRDSLVVRVRDRRGQALANARVAFRLEGEAPGASISPDTAETGAEGMAHARWVLGNANGTQTALAAVVGTTGLIARFDAEVGAAGAALIERLSGEGQLGARGAPLADPLVVRVTDGLGNPVAGVTVEWTTDDGSVDPAASVTGSNGRASTTWTLGSSVGEQTAEARSGGLEGSPLGFTATASSGDASRLVRVSGNGQSARAGDELDDPLVVRVEDQDGNGVPGRAVSWVVATGGGSVSDLNSTSDENGRASTRWTMGAEPGGNILNAVVSGIGAVSFNATATGGGGGARASQLGFRVQPSDTEEDDRISPPVEVVVLDQAGNRVTGGEFRIKLDLIGNRRGDLEGDSEESTVSGVATFNDLRVDREGNYRLRASTDGLPSVESDHFEVEDD